MRLLIDGYNLLHATDLFGEGDLEGTLRGSREALLDFLIRNLSEQERKATTIIFDAAQAPPNLPNKYNQEGILVWFARDYPDADSLMEEILDSNRSSRDLIVVSHDRRVQRAARSSGAKPVDSSQWFQELKLRSANRNRENEKPVSSVPGKNEWKKTFQDEELQKEIDKQNESLSKRASQTHKPAPKKTAKSSNASETNHKDPSSKPHEQEFGKGIFDPFPPGYGEDLLDEQ